MHRDINQTAAVLGLKPRFLRQKLRELGVINQMGELRCTHRQGKNFFVDTRSRWNKSINTYSHYGVVMVTESGINWIAQKLTISIRKMPSKNAA